MLRIQLILISLLFFYGTAQARLEYIDEISYKQDHPLGQHNGNDGNWLKADRKKQNQVWGTANEVNLKKVNGYTAYRSIEERSAFYHWFQLKTDSLGFETKWCGIAATTTHKLRKLLTVIPSLTGNSNPEIKAFIHTGNQLIFDDIWLSLYQLYTGKVLKGTAARQWDENLLYKEQRLINPSYQGLSHHSLRVLLKSLRKENAFAKFFQGLEFEGDLLSIQDRWNYGMKMMGYQLTQ